MTYKKIIPSNPDARKLEADLSGNKAHELFMSNEPFPLHSFLEDWKSDKVIAHVGYVLAVVGAYNRMLFHCTDGRYGKIR